MMKNDVWKLIFFLSFIGSSDFITVDVACTHTNTRTHTRPMLTLCFVHIESERIWKQQPNPSIRIKWEKRKKNSLMFCWLCFCLQFYRKLFFILMLLWHTHTTEKILHFFCSSVDSIFVLKRQCLKIIATQNNENSHKWKSSTINSERDNIIETHTHKRIVLPKKEAEAAQRWKTKRISSTNVCIYFLILLTELFVVLRFLCFYIFIRSSFFSCSFYRLPPPLLQLLVRLLLPPMPLPCVKKLLLEILRKTSTKESARLACVKFIKMNLATWCGQCVKIVAVHVFVWVPDVRSQYCFVNRIFHWWWLMNAKHYEWKSIIPTMCVFVFECVHEKLAQLLILKTKIEWNPRHTAHCTRQISRKQRTVNAKIVHSFVAPFSALLLQHIVAVVVSLVPCFFPSTSSSRYTVFLHMMNVYESACVKNWSRPIWRWKTKWTKCSERWDVAWMW